MKSAKYIFSLLVLIVAMGCNGVSTHSVQNCQEEDSGLDKPGHPFHSDDSLLFYDISDSIYHNLKRCYPNHPKWGKIYTEEYDNSVLSYEDYLLIDSMARNLYSPNNFSHASDTDWEVNEIGLIKYLNWRLWSERDGLPEYLGRQCVVNLMEKEMANSDSLIIAQIKWCRAHFNTSQEGGTIDLYIITLRRNCFTFKMRI